MRITYRNTNNKEYWTKRWADIPPDQPMENVDAYPLKYAAMTVKNDGGKILEAGCGAGRIVRHYHDRGFDILGIDFVSVAVEKLKAMDSNLQVEVGDVTKLQFSDFAFKYVLAFGLYHNLEHGLEQAIAETYRVLESGGLVCASFRADNIQTRLTDWLADSKKKGGADGGQRSFHKMNLMRKEFVSFFERAGFKVESVFPVQNMPILYKFSIFRAPTHKTFNENMARKEGYQLSTVGHLLQRFLMKYFPNQFCNIYVLIARRAS
jgi:ubiquinone/menaquinone biosynthesis C-methylase UbiE